MFIIILNPFQLPTHLIFTPSLSLSLSPLSFSLSLSLSLFLSLHPSSHPFLLSHTFPFPLTFPHISSLLCFIMNSCSSSFPPLRYPIHILPHISPPSLSPFSFFFFPPFPIMEKVPLPSIYVLFLLSLFLFPTCPLLSLSLFPSLISKLLSLLLPRSFAFLSTLLSAYLPSSLASASELFHLIDWMTRAVKYVT
jgi:hypothetical protein